MKTITQTQVATFAGVSDVFIHEVRRGTKGFSKRKAKELSERTNVPFELLALASGEKVYQALAFAYHQRQEDATA